MKRRGHQNKIFDMMKMKTIDDVTTIKIITSSTNKKDALG